MAEARHARRGFSPCPWRGLPLLLLLLLALLLPAPVQCAAGSMGTGWAYDIPGRGLNAERLSGACDAGDCASCFHRPSCGWCAASKQCMAVADADACARGFSGDVCYASCSDAAEVLHDAAGMIQLGGTGPAKTYYMPNQVCLFNIYPLPESGPGAPGGGQRATVIRLQFEYGAFSAWLMGAVDEPVGRKPQPTWMNKLV